MGESSRRRSSMWDVEEENRRFSSRGRYRDYSSSGAESSMRLKDHPGWLSWEDSIAKDQGDIAEMRDRVEKNNYYKGMSPGLDGVGKQNWDHSPDGRWSRSRRYSGRGKSRSRSRSRSRGRSRGRERSRSRSRSWSHGRNRGRGWSKSRSRSRSRGSPKGRTRSRSPFYDQGRESYGRNDRRSGSGRPSQTCKDFAVGMCRRGSQCRFLHPDNVDHRDPKCLETGQAGKWRSKPESGHGSRYPYEKRRDKFSDAYGGEDVPQRNWSRGVVTCVEFIKGSCRYGAACRFSHPSVSENDNYDRGSRNTAVDPEHEHRQNNSSKAMCKFFLVGKCQRNNCRFSHDGPTSNDLEDRSHCSNGGKDLVDANKRWDGPTWDDITKSSNVRTESGWSEGGVANMDLSEEFSIDQRSDWRSHNTDNNVLGSVAHNDNGFNRENSFRERGEQVASQNFQSQNADRFSPSQRRDLSGEASSHFLSTTMPKISITSDIRQREGIPECNSVKAFGSGPLYELKDSAHTKGQNINLENSSVFVEHSSLVSGADQGEQAMSPMSPMSPIANIHHVDLNWPAQHLSSPLSLQQSHQVEVARAELRESNVPYSCPAVVPGEQAAPVTTLPPHLTQNHVDELRPQLHTVSGPSDSMTMAPCHNTAQSVLSAYTLNITDSARCLDQNNPVHNFTEHAKSSNNDPPPSNSSYSNGQENQKPRQQPPLPLVNPEFDKFHQSGSSGVDYPDISKLNQHEAAEKSEVNGNGKVAAVGSKSVPQNTSENVDGQGKDEGGNSNKDDKGMRLFKNALIEFVKDILKPTWKEGRMSREVHKTIVKKVVDKVTSSIQGEHVPKTQDRIEQYLSSSKPKISKLVQAYVERSHKTDS